MTSRKRKKNTKNQAILVPGGPVQVYAPGFRNAYDLEITQAGRMYTVDNGPNAGWGGIPVNEGPGGNCTNGVSEPGKRAPIASVVAAPSLSPATVCASVPLA